MVGKAKALAGRAVIVFSLIVACGTGDRVREPVSRASQGGARAAPELDVRGETVSTMKTSMGPPIKSGDDEVVGRAEAAINPCGGLDGSA